MEKLKVTFRSGRKAQFNVENCNEALTKLAQLKSHNLNVKTAIFRDIDLNLSLATLHDIASYLLRRENNVTLGNKYLEIIQLKNTIFN